MSSSTSHLVADEEPPYPKDGVRHLISPVVRYADAGEPVGQLVATVVIDSQGRPCKITIYRSPDQVLTRFVAPQLATEEYKPAVCRGQPCEMTYVLRLDFPRRGGMHVSESTSTYDPNSKSDDGH